MTRPDRWLVIRVNAPSAEHAALLAEGLFVFGIGGLEEKDGQLITYLPDPGDVDAYVATLHAHLQESAPESPFTIDWAFEPARDWDAEWKRGLAPRRVGERLIIAPSWTTPEPRPNDIVITIDPQMAFGTGEHASTRGALRILESVVRGGERVIDVGAGSAVLAIAAVKLGAREALAVELDPDAVINAQENIDGNDVTDAVTLECALVDDAYLHTPGQFHIILANILSGVIIPLLPAFRRALIDANGSLIVAGILQTEAEAFSAAAAQHGFRVERDDREEEWWSALLRRTA